MKYYLLKIPIRSGKPENVMTFEIELIPSGLFKLDEKSFLVIFKANHCIGMVDKNGLNPEWLGLPNNRGVKSGVGVFARLDFPSSVCRSQRGNICYVVESGGSRIRRIDIYTGYLSSIFGEVLDAKMEKYISKQPSIESIVTSCCLGENETIYWTSSNLHRCFEFVNSDVISLVGNGRSGYSVSSNISDCAMSYPIGVVFDKGSIYIADSGNHCIRRLDDKSFCVVAGNPLKAGDEDGEEPILSNPSNLKMARKLLCFLDGNKVKCLSLNSKHVETVYTSDKIVAIEVDSGNLFVLEHE